MEIALFLVDECNKSGGLHGYKIMHLKCLQEGYVVTRETDGFSRYVLWLEAHVTNSDPKLVAGYFMECIKRNNGCPRVRTDKGTEHGYIQQMQLFLRRNGQDQYANSCVLTGSSTHNQRIEQWWGFLRKQNIQYWMDLFLNLTFLGCFDGVFLDKALIQFCFMNIIQGELDGLINLWNHHSIRRTKHNKSPHGRPVILFSFPQTVGGDDFIQAVPDNEINMCFEQCRLKEKITCDATVFDLCTFLIKEGRLEMPDNGESGVVLYQQLRNQILEELEQF